ncbi:MAG: hypothetical protein UY62_C0019G0018 [Parcubacteria group bacterium GW2011_GWF2_50_9]|nr:MAG: hypothetical protein UY62_C0019G0018 [Parcubacteria group bacterium GW2011_GWF2_50_9]
MDEDTVTPGAEEGTAGEEEKELDPDMLEDTFDDVDPL